MAPTSRGVSHAPYGHVLSFKNPDGIALEFFCLPSPPE
jgi:hypothetical protein